MSHFEVNAPELVDYADDRRTREPFLDLTAAASRIVGLENPPATADALAQLLARAIRELESLRSETLHITFSVLRAAHTYRATEARIGESTQR